MYKYTSKGIGFSALHQGKPGDTSHAVVDEKNVSTAHALRDGEEVRPRQTEKTDRVHTPLTDWLDGQDVMLTLHISERTLYNYRQQGLLPYTRFAGKIYYRRSDLEALLDQNYSLYNTKNN